MTYASICAGIGGFDLGLDAAGFSCLWQCEIDKSCRGVLARYWPEVPRYDDMLRLPLASIPRPNILCAGTPCQAFSVAGKRQSLADSRGNLTLAFAIICDALDPEYILWENVPGVLSAKDNAFGAFLGSLVGADSAIPPIRDGKWPRAGLVAGPRRAVGWRVLDAQWFGVAQRRRRVFVVGHSSVERVCEILFESESVRRDSAPSRETGQGVTQGVAGSLGGGSGSRGFCDDLDRSGAFVPLTARALNSKPDPQDPTFETYVAHSLRAEGFDASEDGTGRGTPIIPIQEVGKRTGSGGEGQNGCGIGSKGDPMFTLQASAQHAVAFDTTQVTSKLNRSNPKPGDPCHPLASGAHAPAVAFTWSVRRLTPTECARLQGFPDDWNDHLADGPRYRQLGNAVNVAVSKWLAARIAMAEAKERAA